MTLRVAQITDIHLTAQPGSELYGVDTAFSLEIVMDEIKQLPTPPDLIIATGDLAEDGSKTTYERLRGILARLEIPVYVLPGNHDNVSNMLACFNVDKIFFTNVTELSNWGFLFVNSQVESHSHGCVSSTEISEIKKYIAEFGNHPILVALHHTPSNVCPSSGCKLLNSVEFTTLLNSHRNIKGVIAGHTHNASEINTEGHVQFTTPSTFAHVSHAQFGEPVDHEDFWASHSLDGSIQGFRILDLFPDGTIRSEVHWIRNET